MPTSIPVTYLQSLLNHLGLVFPQIEKHQTTLLTFYLEMYQTRVFIPGESRSLVLAFPLKKVTCCSLRSSLAFNNFIIFLHIDLYFSDGDSWPRVLLLSWTCFSSGFC